MKKVIIATNQMIRGGVEIALISMLKAMNMTQIDVTVLLMRRGGALEKRIPSTVRVIYVDELGDPKGYIKGLAVHGHPVRALQKTWCFYRSIKAKSYWDENSLLAEFLPAMQDEYDVAIAYHAPGTLPVHYVLHNIVAKNKVLWIHGDVEKAKSTGEKYRQIFMRYDRIVCVSKDAENVFIKFFPELKQKCQTVHNIIDTEYIDKAIQEPESERYSICTVARLSPEKGIDLAIEACARLIHKYPDIRWCVCGGGPEEGKLLTRIEDNKLKGHFLLLGDQDNPYKYIMASEIFVQPSIHEGCSVALGEARYLCKPIVTTCTTGARDQLIDGVNGTIVGINAQEIADAVDEMLANSELRNKYVSNLRQSKFNGDCESIMRAIQF